MSSSSGASSRALVLWALAGLLALLASATLSWQGDRLAHEEQTAVWVVPPPGAVEAVATGERDVLADGFWIAFIQYYGEKLITDRKFQHLYDGLDLITDLDPRFESAYLFGSWVLGDSGHDREMEALLEKGWARHPHAWIYPWQLGFVEFLYEKRYLVAARHFLDAAHLGGPPICKRLAAEMYQKGDKTALAVATWKAVYQRADNAYTRGVARRSLEKLGIKP